MQYKFAVRIADIANRIKKGEFAECIPLLSEALHICPKMSAAVSRMTNFLNERLKTARQPVSEEFAEAYGVLNQLITLLPDDTEILKLKQEIVRNL